MSVRKVVILLIVVFLLSSCAGVHTGGNNRGFLKNSEENEIFTQAIAAGAIIGGGTGLVACNQFNLSKSERILCTGGATVAGGVLGYIVGAVQTDNLNQRRLENNRMATVLNQARQYNNKVISYNSRLRQDIRNLEQARNKNPKDIEVKINAAENELDNLQEAIEERQGRIAQLSDDNQKRQYENTLRTLEVEKTSLDASIKKLKRLGSVAIGA